MSFSEQSNELKLLHVRHKLAAEVNPDQEELGSLIQEIIAHTDGQKFLKLKQAEKKKALEGFQRRLVRGGVRFSPPRFVAEYLDQAFTINLQDAAIAAAGYGNLDIFVTMFDISFGSSVVLRSIEIAEEEAQREKRAQDTVRYAEFSNPDMGLGESADIFLALANRGTATARLYQEDLTGKKLVREARKLAIGEPSRLPGNIGGSYLISEAVAAGANWAAGAYQELYPLAPGVK